MIPDLSTPRSRLDKDSPQAIGITPFVLMPRDTEEKPPEMMMAAASDEEACVSFPDRKTDSEAASPDSLTSMVSFMSDASCGSMQPLKP